MLGSVAEDASEPLLPLEVLASAENSTSDDRAEVEAVIDAGFDGEITLPEATIRRLGYPYIGSKMGHLTDVPCAPDRYHASKSGHQEVTM